MSQAMKSGSFAEHRQAAGKLSGEEIRSQSELSDRLFPEEKMYHFMENYAKDHELPETREALPFARRMHEGQVRRGKDHVPFIYHPLIVACHAVSLGLTEDAMIASALLHDVCEDCDVMPSELPVSQEVQEAVSCLTRVSGPKRRTPEGEREYYDRISGNRIATIVKLLDRCHNISSMTTGFTSEGIQYYVRNTEEWVYPLIDYAEKTYPQYEAQLFAIRYHMQSVMENIKRGFC